MSAAEARRIFEEACELPESERAAYIAGACVGRDDLRLEVESLIEAFSRAGSFLGAPATAAVTMDDAVGTAVGPYTIEARLGEGGFGVVYRARQEEPIRRQVAIKILKRGMDTDAVIARFESERHTLALMDHTNIARVLDAGATPTGQPYFVMELVAGVSITEFCDGSRLDTRERLQLLEQVCSAVQHAHQKGIIHRDLKPSNVLVAMEDGRAVPKVIDFGIAKAVDPDHDQRTMVTAVGQLVGTPQYMSPEQAAAEPDIDTRADVYALGVIMYELLTGTTPVRRETLREAALNEIGRIIAEGERPKPSTRLSSLGEALDGVAELRATNPPSLSRYVRGDLDWITMKAIDVDRTRRYDSPSALAAEIARFLADEPVDAGPPSATYRIGKFMRRHRAGVVATAVIALLSIGGAVGTIVGLVRANDAMADTIDAQAAEAAAHDEAEAVNDFLRFDVLSRAAPSSEEGAGRDATILDVLYHASAELEDAVEPGGRFHGRPAVEAAIRTAIGQSFIELSDFDASRPHLGRALEIRGELHDADHPRYLEALHDWATQQMFEGDYDAALDTARTCKAARVAAFGVDDVGTQHSTRLEAELLIGLARYDEALAILDRLEPRVIATRGSDHLEVYQVQGTRAEALFFLGRFQEAIDLRREIYAAICESHGAGHPEAMVRGGSLADLLAHSSNRESALEEIRALHDVSERLLGPDHHTTLRQRGLIGSILTSLGQFGEAEQTLRDVVDRRAATLGETSNATIEARMRLGNVLALMQRIDEADALLALAFEQAEQALGPDHLLTLSCQTARAVAFRLTDRFEEAEVALREVIPRLHAVHGPDHHDTLYAEQRLIEVVSGLDREPEIEALCRSMLERRVRLLGPEHSQTLVSRHQLGWVCWRVGKADEAVEILRGTLDARLEVLGPHDPETVWTANTLAGICRDLGRLEEALDLYTIALDGQLAIAGPVNVYTVGYRRALIRIFDALGDADAATTQRHEINEALRAIVSRPDPSPWQMNELAWNLLNSPSVVLRDPEEALRYSTAAVEATNHEVPEILDTHALAQFENGDVAGAIETQQRILTLIGEEHEMHAQVSARLDDFRAALDDG